MKKIASIILTVVLVASMFTMLGVTASAEKYDVTTNKTIVHYTFDTNKGVQYTRASGKTTYENGYVDMFTSGSNGSSFWMGEGGWLTFQANVKYIVEFDFKILSCVASKSEETFDPYLYVSTTPSGSLSNFQFDSTTNLKDKVDNTTTITYTGSETEWATAHYEFTPTVDGLALAIVWKNHTATDIHAAVDNFKVMVPEGASFEYNVELSKDFTKGDQLNSPLSISNAAAAYDANGMTLTGSNQTSRLVFRNDIAAFTFDKKYYVSFDATATSSAPYLNVGVGAGTYNDRANLYTFFSGTTGLATGITVFVNGVEKDITGGLTINRADGKVNVGIVIDATNEEFKNAVTTAINGKSVFFYIGNANGNIVIEKLDIVSLTEVNNVAAPATTADAKYSIRKIATNVTAGLRFRGTVSNDVKAAADEIGFVVAPSSSAVSDGWYDLAAGIHTNAKTAIAYSKAEGTDIVYSTDANTTSYQFILANLTSYDGSVDITERRFAAVMYVKTGSNYTYYDLGEISYKQVLAEYAVRGK